MREEPDPTAPARRPWRGAAVGFVLFGGVGLLFFFGAAVLGVSGPDAARRWLAAAHGPWALPAAVGGFSALAFLGVPQFVLIAAAAAAFGPWRGLAYSWVGTMVSALIGYGLGRAWGGRLLEGRRGVAPVMALIARNGLLASLAIRLAPFAPFVVVNMAAGVAGVSLADFVIGTGLGILPKIAVTALAGGQVAGLLSGREHGVAVVLLVLAGAIWLGAGLMARRWARR
jgi:uncharacterized membrane protein YdjX (TVP38/TMEM64 family)